MDTEGSPFHPKIAQVRIEVFTILEKNEMHISVFACIVPTFLISMHVCVCVVCVGGSLTHFSPQGQKTMRGIAR